MPTAALVDASGNAAACCTASAPATKARQAARMTQRRRDGAPAHRPFGRCASDVSPVRPRPAAAPRQSAESTPSVSVSRRAIRAASDDVVRDDDEAGREVRVQLGHQREHLGRGTAVEVAGRLVGEHARRPRDERAGERRALPLAARQLARSMVQPMREADATEQVARGGARGVRRLAPDPQRHRDVVERAEFRQQMVELVDEAEAPVAHVAARDLGQRREVGAVDRDAARRRRVEPAEQVQQRALAGTRRADDRDRLGRLNRERHAAQHVHGGVAAAERLREPLACEHRRAGSLRGRRRGHRVVDRVHAAPRRRIAWLNEGRPDASFIAQRLRRLDARRAPARIERRDERQQHRHACRSTATSLPVQVARQLADEVDVLRQERDVEHVLDEADDRADVESRARCRATTPTKQPARPISAPCTTKIASTDLGDAPSVRRIAMSASLSRTLMTSDDTRLNAATATISARMMNIIRFSTCTAANQLLFCCVQSRTSTSSFSVAASLRVTSGACLHVGELEPDAGVVVEPVERSRRRRCRSARASCRIRSDRSRTRPRR